MKYCQNCLQPNTRPGTKFIDNKCPACDYILHSDNIDWKVRIETLKVVIGGIAKSSKSEYDCILGVSGGKDSTRLALWARDYLGLNPLLVCVSYPPEQLTKIGSNNLNNLTELGFDVYLSAPSPIIWKDLMKKSFLESANWAKSTELALFAGVPKIAIELGINLILWGENPGLQLGALEVLGENGWDGNNLRNMNTLSGMPTEWLQGHKYTTNQILPYLFPNEIDFLQNNLQVVFLGWAMRSWSLLQNGLVASLNNLEMRGDKSINTSDLIGVTSLDEDWVILNQMVKFYKYGFGRATDYVNEWIRLRLITREQGIQIINKYDGACNINYIKSFCKYISISEDEFWQVVKSFTNKDLFSISTKKRPEKKFRVGQDLL